MPRLVVVSNRVAVPDPEGPRQAGGLAVAVNAALKHREGLWFGWSGADQRRRGGRAAECRRAPPAQLCDHRPVARPISRNTTTASPTGCCGRSCITGSISPSSPRSTSAAICGSTPVSPKRCRGFIRPDDWIWVHDYHLLPLAKELRARGHDNPIGFFLHIPCPPPDILMALPQHMPRPWARSAITTSSARRPSTTPTICGIISSCRAATSRAAAIVSTSTGAACSCAPFRSRSRPRVYARTARSAIRSDFANEMRDSLNGRQPDPRRRPARLLEGHPPPHPGVRPVSRHVSRTGAATSPISR